MGPWNHDADPDVCTDRLATLLASRYLVVVQMVLLAVALQGCSTCLLVNGHYELRFDASRVLEGLPPCSKHRMQDSSTSLRSPAT